MPSNIEFEKGYKRLNNEQKQAVDAIDGPVMVIAGPGTGKTQILALRIANILLQTDTSPDSILALTFTESGVHQMRTRLVSIIGQAGYKINIFTFHGFCNEVISKYPEEFPRILGSVPATDIDQIQIIEQGITDLSLTLLKPYGDNFFYVRPALSIIRSLKRENIGPEDFEKLVQAQQKDFESIDDLYHEKGAHKGKMKGIYADLKKKINKNRELIEIYKKYEEGLTSRKLFDFEDMIREVVKALSTNQDLLLQLQEKYQYILADEHQDANAGQNKLLELLSNFHNNPNLFIVGDEKQAIFRFQGASLDNFLYFKKLFPSAQLISLQNNYRSTQKILDAAHSLIGNNRVSDEKLRVELLSKGESHPEVPLSVYEFTKSDCEYRFVVNNIQEKIKAGIKPSEIAVIYRENRDAAPILKWLERCDVPFTIFSDQNILEDADIRNFILLLQTINNYANEELVAQILYSKFFNLSTLDIFKVITFAKKQKLKIADTIHDADKLVEAGVKDPESFVKLSLALQTWCSLAKNQPLVEVFEAIVHQSGFLPYILSLPDSLEKMAKLDNLFTEVKKIAEANKTATLAHFIQFIHAIGQYNVLLKTGVVGHSRESIRLMTAHKSKGLEFEHVYIIGVNDGHWGNKREMNQFHIPLAGINARGVDPIEDERRLFYVALTRAKKHVTISYSTTKNDKAGLMPSVFISEINNEHVEFIPTTEIEAHIDCKPEEAYAPAINKGLHIKDQEFIRKLFLEQGWSVTALNNYLKCPWNYFFTNLIRMPVAENKHMLYGTAIHATLKDYFKAYAEEREYPIETVLSLFEQHMRRLPFSDADFDASLEKGVRALTGYFETYKNTWPRRLLTEFSIFGTSVEVTKENRESSENVHFDIPIRGVLDKIEILDGHKVNVVDYKTAKPQTRNELMGKTKNSTGDYFRQLVFYKLLLDKFEPDRAGHPKYELASAEIDFLESDDKDRYHKERFEITDEDVAQLVSTINDASYDIYSGEFWSKNCDDKDCEFCALRKMIG